ncbi:MAG: hypothetical protein ABJN75_04915 [Hoeflea sp.]|uniref:hypothetical protein n=1 Tax=Hoeflea sp. TaxID=1940281 RepID=UPI003296C96A
MKGPIGFEKAMHGIYTTAKAELGYNARIFLRMLHDHGGLGTAKKLINADTISDGYAFLTGHDRLDLTVEYLVVNNEKWHHLFEPIEIERARKRLGALNETPGS